MDNRRLILLCIFSFSLVMLWDAWQKHNLPKSSTPAATAAASAGSAAVPTPSATLPAASANAASPTVPAPAATVANGEVVEVKTDLFVARISAQGGDFIGLQLNNYKATEDKSKTF